MKCFICGNEGATIAKKKPYQDLGWRPHLCCAECKGRIKASRKGHIKRITTKRKENILGLIKRGLHEEELA